MFLFLRVFSRRDLLGLSAIKNRKLDWPSYNGYVRSTQTNRGFTSYHRASPYKPNATNDSVNRTGPWIHQTM